MDKEISIILPVFNEIENISGVVKEISLFMPTVVSEFEIILVDDASNDGSAKLLDSIEQNNNNIRVIHHRRNKGYGSALKSGLKQAKYPLIFFMDADGQFDIRDISVLLCCGSTFDIVTGIRLKRCDSLYRVTLGKFYARINCLFFGVSFADINCGFKLINKEVLDKICLKSNSGFITTEILVKANSLGYRIKEAQVNHYPRLKGKQKGASLKNFFRKVSDMAKLIIEFHV